MELELLDILKTMNVPKSRLTLSDFNLLWLNKNIQISNRQHLKLKRAVEIIHILLKSRKFERFITI